MKKKSKLILGKYIIKLQSIFAISNISSVFNTIIVFFPHMLILLKCNVTNMIENRKKYAFLKVEHCTFSNIDYLNKNRIKLAFKKC